jgi:hypothetical protein
VIGEPLSRTVQCLKEAQVISRNVPVFLAMWNNSWVIGAWI